MFGNRHVQHRKSYFGFRLQEIRRRLMEGSDTGGQLEKMRLLIDRLMLEDFYYWGDYSGDRITRPEKVKVL